MNHSMRFGSGSTVPGKTDWKPYEPNHPIPGRGIFVDVDTSEFGFTKTPNYVASLCGNSSHWELTGTSSIYDPTPTKFRIYLRRSYNKHGQETPPLTPDMANKLGWYVTWVGVEVRPISI